MARIDSTGAKLMGTGEIIACVSLGIGLLAYAWRAGGVSSTFEAGMKALTTQHDELKAECKKLREEYEALAKIPELERRIGALEALVNAQSSTIHSIRPQVARVEEHVKALDHRVNSIKSMGAIRPRAGSYRSGDDDE